MTATKYWDMIVDICAKMFAGLVSTVLDCCCGNGGGDEALNCPKPGLKPVGSVTPSAFALRQEVN